MEMIFDFIHYGLGFVQMTYGIIGIVYLAEGDLNDGWFGFSVIM